MFEGLPFIIYPQINDHTHRDFKGNIFKDIFVKVRLSKAFGEKS